MSQSLSKLYTHLIFHIKKSACTPILNEDKSDLYAYIGRIIKDLESQPIIINGTQDHIHIFCIMSKNISLSGLTKDIKRHSSRWIKNKGNHYNQFAWQGGYGGFSVSPSLRSRTVQYIQNQEEHHRMMTFKEEYILFLKEYEVEFDERYVWEED